MLSKFIVYMEKDQVRIKCLVNCLPESTIVELAQDVLDTKVNPPYQFTSGPFLVYVDDYYGNLQVSVFSLNNMEVN
jgi:hypothetical protein